MSKHYQTKSFRKRIKDIFNNLTYFLHMSGVLWTRFIRNRNFTPVLWAFLKSYVLKILKYTEHWNTEGLYIYNYEYVVIGGFIHLWFRWTRITDACCLPPVAMSESLNNFSGVIISFVIASRKDSWQLSGQLNK